MAIAAEILSKVSDIVRTELSKRLPESIRVHRVVAQALQADDHDFIHVVVIYEGEREDLNPRMLNEFDEEIEPLLMDIGVHPVPPISYINRKNPGQWTELQSVQPQDGHSA